MQWGSRGTWRALGDDLGDVAVDGQADRLRFGGELGFDLGLEVQLDHARLLVVSLAQGGVMVRRRRRALPRMTCRGGKWVLVSREFPEFLLPEFLLGVLTVVE
jgi:hypothetical protein